MKQIADRLGSENYPVIDMTLKQFGLPIGVGSKGRPDFYVLMMLEDATDKELIDLAAHVGYQVDFVEAPPRAETPVGANHPLWKNGMYRLFLSHLAAQKKYASDLQKHLLPYYISCFVAHTDIAPTSEWQTEIETALLTCDSLVALLHKTFHDSKWTDQEIGFAMGRGVPAFAVRLRDRNAVQDRPFDFLCF